jgi:hypothetical protein
MTVKDLERLKNAGLIRGYSQVEVINNPKKPKFGNIKTTIDGIVFDSQKEAKRYVELRYLLKAGHIKYLERQVEFQLNVNGEKVASYYADFVYEKDGVMIVEDVKSRFTKGIATYRLKKKLMKSVHGIEIQEY